MNTADKILKRKTFIRAEMDKYFPKAESDALWKRSSEKLSEILARYQSLPRGVHVHTDNYIFPAAAVYLTVKEAAGKETAFSIVENASVTNSLPMGKKLSGLMKLP